MSSSSEKICRWGILGSAQIARKNWQAIRHAENATLVGVASRSVERSGQYIAENQGHTPFETAPEAIGGYQELIERPDIDAVYVPLPTGVRKDWVLKAAAAGKHVLCEKPCGASAVEVREMIDACAAAGVQFMDGVMFMHSSRMAALRGALDDPLNVGELRRITSQFSFLAPDEFFTDNIRASGELEPLGCLGDLGWYNVRLALWAMRFRLPERVTGRLLAAHGEARVPTDFSGELFFAGGVSASFYCSFLCGNQEWANLSGTSGNIHLDDFVLPYKGPEVAFTIHNARSHQDGCNFQMEGHSRRVAVDEHSDSSATAQETNLFRNFSALALGGTPDPHWPEIALQTQQVIDACLVSARDGGREVVPE